MTSSDARPGDRLSRLLLRLLAPGEWRESILGDLAEECERRRKNGHSAGALWHAAASLTIALKLRTARWRSLLPADAAPAARGWMPLAGTGADVHSAIRSLLAHRVYAASAILTLALGIGANAAVFHLANWLLLRNTPGIRDQSRMVTMLLGSGNGVQWPMSYLDLQQIKAGAPALEGLAGYQNLAVHASVNGGDARRVDAQIVTGTFFDVLGAPLTAGRGFSNSEGADPNAPRVVVISHRLWRDMFAGDGGALGRTMTINGVPWTIVGIGAPGFNGASLMSHADLWVPIAQWSIVMPSYPATVLTSRRTALLFGAIGRLAPSSSVAAAQAQTDVVRAQIALAHPEDKGLAARRFAVSAGVEAQPWARKRMSDAFSMLGGIVGLLLLLTCANVGNLMLARAAARRSEIATRLALGASRFRTIRLLLIESALLSACAGAAALAIAWFTGALLAGSVLVPGGSPITRAQMDWRVFAFAFALSSIVAMIAGVVPAVGGTRVDLSTAFRDGTRSVTGGRRQLRRVLTAAQVAIALALLIGAILLARSMAARLAIDPGYDPSKVLSVSIEPGLQHGGRPPLEIYRDVLQRIRDTPGVRAAGLGWLQPYSMNAADTSFKIQGAAADAPSFEADVNHISPGYIVALGLRLIDGRDFTDAEMADRPSGAETSAIVTASLAKRAFGSGSAIGRRIVQSGNHVDVIVGVVGDTRQRTLNDADMLFEPFGQSFVSGWGSLEIGLNAPEADVLPGIRRAVQDVDPTLPIYNVVRLDEASRRQFGDDELVAMLARIFAILAALLAAIGLYGVLARGVAERRREFGIRSALGAAPRSIARLVGIEAVGLLVAGLSAGVLLSWWLVTLLQKQLYGVQRTDAASWIAAAVLTISVVALASWPAVRRAVRLDPSDVLRA